MKDLPPEFVLATTKRFQSAPWIWLLESVVPTDPPEALRVTNHTTLLDFDADNTGSPQRYYPKGFTFGEIEFDAEGNLPALPLSVSNVSRDILGTVLENDLLTGQQVRLMLVNADTLDQPAAKLDFDLEIGSTSIDETAMTFRLSSADLHAVPLPVERFQRDTCGYLEYGGVNCGFDIAQHDPDLSILGECGRLEPDCTLRGDLEVANGQPRKHPLRWGGFKGLPLSGA